MTPEEHEKQNQIYGQLAELFVASGGAADFGDLMTWMYKTGKEIERLTGNSLAQVVAQIWDVLGANWVESGKDGHVPEKIGKTTADIENKVDALTKKVDLLLAKLTPAS